MSCTAELTASAMQFMSSSSRGYMVHIECMQPLHVKFALKDVLCQSGKYSLISWCGDEQDPVLLRWLDPGRRYFPAAASTTLVLGPASVMTLLTGLRSWSLAGWLGQAICLGLAIALHWVGLLVSHDMHFDAFAARILSISAA